MLGIDALDTTLEVEQRRDGLFQTFSVVLVFAALLKLLKKQKKKQKKSEKQKQRTNKKYDSQLIQNAAP